MSARYRASKPRKVRKGAGNKNNGQPGRPRSFAQKQKLIEEVIHSLRVLETRMRLIDATFVGSSKAIAEATRLRTELTAYITLLRRLRDLRVEVRE